MSRFVQKEARPAATSRAKSNRKTQNQSTNGKKMKTLWKSLLTLAALALLSTTGAQAQTVLHLTGSTSFRSAVYNAITHVLTSPTAVYIGNTLASANDAAFQGTFGGNTYSIECHWGGSVTGVVGLTAPASNKYNFQTYLSGSATSVTAGGQSNFYSPYGLLPGVGGGFQIASSGGVSSPDVASADVGFSDVFQNTAAAITSTAKSSPTLVDNKVGVLPYAFVKSSANTSDTDIAAYNDLTDITGNNTSTLFGNGFLDFQLLTGGTADANAYAYAVGRDEDSGTRMAAFAESGFGVANVPEQYEITTSGNAANGPTATVANIVLQSQGTFPSISGGYNSGSSVADALATPGWDPVGQGYGIAYLAAADTDTAITEGFAITSGVTGGSATYTAASLSGNNSGADVIAPGDNVYFDTLPTPSTPPSTTVQSVSGTSITLNATINSGTHTVIVDVLPSGYVRPHILTFNGVAPTQANVTNGKYQFWEYEHLFYPSSFTSNPSYSLVTAIKNDLVTSDAQVAGYLLSTLTSGNGTVTKSSEGATINLQ
jgi:hypothetical protein